VRDESHNLVIFMDRDSALSLEILAAETVDWVAWRRRQR
jgi:hypothetical protein